MNLLPILAVLSRWSSARTVATLVLVALWFGTPGKAADAPTANVQAPSTTDPLLQAQRVLEQAKELQEHYRLRVAIPDAVQADAPSSGPAAVGQNTIVVEPASSHSGLWMSALALVFGVLALRRFAPERFESILSYLNPWTTAESVALAAEDRAFSEFLVTFKAGPAPRVQDPPPPACSITQPLGAPADATPAKSPTDPIKRFFSQAPASVAGARKRLQETASESAPDVRQKSIEVLSREMGNLKELAGSPELLPAWQLASTLESLLKQLIAQPGRVTPPTLRSLAAGFDVLAELCKPGVDPGFCADPAPRFLAVDDDSISRHAVSLSLKKAFNQPDVVSNGEAALVLASSNAYDAVFLDIMMPGMNGFELCSKIHETAHNHTTPVVFVSCRRDPEAQAQLTDCGGTDLLEKPFLTFELALKALTLMMRGRLQARAGATEKAAAAGQSTDAVSEPFCGPAGIDRSQSQQLNRQPHAGARP